MWRLVVVLLVVPLPLASAEESRADCEAEPDWAFWRSSEPVRERYEEAGAPGGARTCEGEHWDGQDAVAPSETQGEPCLYGAQTRPDGATAALCQGSDPNERLDAPATARASLRSRSGATTDEAYVALRVAHAGRVALYVGACHGGAGLEGAPSCAGPRQVRGALYARDETPGNLAWSGLSALGLTGGHVAEGDCSHDEYVRSVRDLTGQARCGRDNTALTADLLP